MVYSKEFKKLQQKKLLIDLKDLYACISTSSNFENKIFALKLIDKIINYSNYYSEILRLSDSLVTYRLNDINDTLFKNYIKYNLTKLYNLNDT